MAYFFLKLRNVKEVQILEDSGSARIPLTSSVPDFYGTTQAKNILIANYWDDD